MPDKVFKDPLLEKTFQQKGYVSVPFLSTAEVDELTRLFFETIEESGGPKTPESTDFNSKADITYDFTFIDKNVDYKRKVYDIITQRFQKKADHYLNGYKPIIANYIRKKEGGGEVPMHQNWAFVDEEKYTSVSIWVPLVDSNEENGTLQMVDGSHKRFGKLRGPMIPWELRNLKDQIIGKHLTPMNIKAGEGVILDDSIVHYSNINKTPGLRLAIQLIMIPESAQPIHYHLDRTEDANKVHMLETDVEFYMNFHPWLKPVGNKELKSFHYNEEELTYENFLQVLNGSRFDIEPLFVDKNTQEKFERDGFVKIPLLNAGQIEHLKNYYTSTNAGETKQGFHISLENKSEEQIKVTCATLYSTLVPELDKVLTNYKTFTASYVVKEPGLNSVVPPHQDWSFVDEAQFSSATVWVPLIDVTKDNGALGIIKGSHQLFTAPRSSPSPQAKSVLSDHMFNLFPYVEVIDMKAGEALIFNNKTIHASPPNMASQPRIGVGIGITQKEAPLLHYYTLPDAEQGIEVYEVDESFFFEYNNSKLSKMYDSGGKPAELNKVGQLPRSGQHYTKEEITQLVCSTPGVKVNSELMKEMAALYNYAVPKAEPGQTEVWVDKRNFFQIYTPMAILRGLKRRLGIK